MEGQSSATTASPQPVPVDEMRSTRDSTAAQESDRGYECCDWAGTDKNVPECETGNKGASTSCTPSVGEIRSQHDTIVYVLQNVQSNKMVIQVPVIADESGVINCAESGLAESKDTPTVVRDPQATSLTGPDCDFLDVPDKAGNKSSTYDVTECSSHVDLVTGESHSDKTITVLSTDTHNRTTIVECNSRFIPQVDLTQTTSCTKNSSPQRDTEAQKEGNLGHHLLDAAVGGKCFSTSGDSLLSETTNYKQISEDGKEGEKSLGVARIGTGGVEDKVKTAHKLLMAASSCQSGSLPPFSLSMLITDRKQQGQTKKGAWGRSGLFNKETSTVVRKRSTELSENQNVFEEGPHAAQPEEQQQMLSCDTKVLSHNEEQALGHAPKGLPEMEKNSESGSISDDTACEAKDGDSGLIFVEPGKKSEPLTEDEDMEEAGSGNMHIGHPDCSSANAVKATDVVTWEGSILQVKDNSGEDYIGNSEEKLMEEDMGSTKGKTSKSIEVSIGLDEKMTAEENMPEVGNSESTSNKSEAFPREANRPDQCKEEIQSEHLHKWRQSFTCNICSYTAFSVKDIEDHCIRCEQENAVPDNKEVNDNESDEMECEEVINDSTSVGSVLQLTDSSHCDALKERPHAKVLPDKTGPTISECDLPSPPDAQSTPVILSKQNSTVVQDGSPSPLQNKVLAGEGTPSDNVQAKHVTRGKKRSRRNIHQGEDHIIAGWKAIVVHPPRGLVRTRTFWHCPDCPYKTDKIYPSIKEHAARHVVSEKFQCDHCTYSCQTQNGIRSHRRMHERDGDPKPGKKDKFEVQVLARQLRRRLRKNRRVYRCYKCSFVTSVHSSFEKHCKRHTRKSKISRIHTQSGNDAMMGESTITDPDLHNELNDGRDLETHEANRSEGETNKAQSPASVANKKLEGQDVEKDDDKCLQRELEVLSETSGSSFTNLSPSEGNAISPRQRAKTKKYSCIKCSFSCNSWLSVKAHMAVHKEGLTNTAMEIESYTDKEELANKLEEMDANDKIACVTVEAQDSSPKKSENIYRCTKCPFTCDRIGWLTKHMKHHEFSQKFSCDLCSYSASHKISLINHQSVHVNDIKKGSTAGAPKVTTSTEGCNREESSTNVADKQQLLYRCKECPYTADHSSILERHEKCHGIWRWHKRLGEMSHAGEQAVSEATVSVAIACNDDTSDSGNPADVALKESNTEVTESREEESRKLHTCNECHFKTDSLFELERHKTSHGSESKHMCNNNDVPSDSKTSEEHHGDNEKGHNNRQDNEDAIMEDQGAEDCETESVITTSAVPSADITFQKEDDKARQTSLISKPKVDEYKYIFHCEDCPFKTDWFHDLQKHKNGHDNEADFSCDKCSFSAATKGAIEVHRRVHRYKGANREAKQCTEHAFSTHSFKSMHLHMQTHNNSDVQADVDEWVASPLPCSDTQKPSTSSMEGGMFRRKMEEYLYIFNCEQCPFKTDWYHELEKHRMGHNANLEFPCDHCTFSSSSKKAVEVHKRVHKDGNALKMERSVADKPNACMSKEEKDKEKEKPRRFPHMTPSGLRYYNHKCPKCPFRTDSRKKVGVHLVHHGAKGKYNCDLCTYSSNHQAALAVHRRVHLHGYDNPHANKGMPIKDTPNDVKNESKRLSPQKSQKCTKCPFKTDSRKKMDVHMVFHRKRGKYKCNLCSYSTDRMSTLGPHRKVHLKHQEAAERSARNVNNEMGVVHSPLAAYRTEPRLDSGQKYSCNACPSKFNSLLDVREHVSHHLRQFSYSCPECTYGADSERSVKSHKGVHERHGDKKCRPVIKHATQATNDLALHSAEEDERPAEVMIKKRKYQCEHCPYSTDKLHKKSSHESNHGANHPNKCHLCSYSTSASIKVHLRVHEKYVRGKTKGQKVDTAGSILTVEKIGSARDHWQYKCSQCPYLAKTASYVRSHQRYHSADLPLKCPDCTFSCSRLQQLSCHAEWHGKPPAQDKQQSSPEVKQKPTKRGRIGTLQQKLYEQGVERIMINGKKHYICPHCPFRSRWADQAVAHLEHHFVMYSYKCAHCSYSTRTKDKVKFHMNLHKKVADDGNGHSTDGGKRLARTAQRDNEAASSPSEAGLTKGPRTRARLGVIGQSPVKHTTPQVSPTSSSVSRNLGDFSSPSGSESAFIRYMTPSCSKEQPEQGQQVTVLTFVCMYCERPFTDQESWLAHMKRHRL